MTSISGLHEKNVQLKKKTFYMMWALIITFFANYQVNLIISNNIFI